MSQLMRIERAEAARRVRAARKAAGLSQREAAARLGVSQAWLSAVETGRRVPSWTRLVALVVTLGLDPKLVAPEFFGPQKMTPGGAVGPS